MDGHVSNDLLFSQTLRTHNALSRAKENMKLDLILPLQEMRYPTPRSFSLRIWYATRCVEATWAGMMNNTLPSSTEMSSFDSFTTLESLFCKITSKREYLPTRKRTTVGSVATDRQRTVLFPQSIRYGIADRVTDAIEASIAFVSLSSTPPKSRGQPRMERGGVMGWTILKQTTESMQ